MQAYRLETTLTESHTLILQNLPFQSGEQVEIIILVKPQMTTQANAYPLRGLPITYLRPFEPAVQADWEAAQ